MIVAKPKFSSSVSRSPEITKPIGVLNQTTYASLFYIGLEWLNNVKEFLKIRQIEGTLLVQQKQRLVKRVKPFTLKNGELYKMGQDNRLRQCLTIIEAQMLMK